MSKEEFTTMLFIIICVVAIICGIIYTIIKIKEKKRSAKLGLIGSVVFISFTNVMRVNMEYVQADFNFNNLIAIVIFLSFFLVFFIAGFCFFERLLELPKNK